MRLVILEIHRIALSAVPVRGLTHSQSNNQSQLKNSMAADRLHSGKQSSPAQQTRFGD